MPTFSVTTLGCKVNQYEGDQISTLLRQRGLQQVEQGGDVRVIHTCSVTMQAAAKSRQTVRRAGRLPLTVLSPSPIDKIRVAAGRVIVTGCWATSNTTEAIGLAGVDAVLPNSSHIADELHRLLDDWSIGFPVDLPSPLYKGEGVRGSVGSTVDSATSNYSTGEAAPSPRPSPPGTEERERKSASYAHEKPTGAFSLPLLDSHRPHHQRGFLKIQDGCDAHCTYCIIPKLRPALFSKPIDQAVIEAQRLVDSGHYEIVLTGIFMSAYGHATALRRRQPANLSMPLGDLIRALCSQVRGLRRLRLSSLEPGDLDAELLAILRDHEQIAPHFHLPLQSGSDRLLKRMNRQYTRDDYRWMIQAVQSAFDRPALTTDIIVGFPGETDDEFAHTRQMLDEAQFIHVHAFSYSPRPGTAAARWTNDFVRGPIVNHRIEELTQRAQEHSLAYRRSFLGETMQVIVENFTGLPRGRCERYFEVTFPNASLRPGQIVSARIDRVASTETFCDETLRSPS